MSASVLQTVKKKERRYVIRYIPKRETSEYWVDDKPVLFVDTPEKVELAMRVLMSSARTGCDVETTGWRQKTHPWARAKAISCQFSCRDEFGRIPTKWANYIFVPNWGKWKGYLEKFKPFLESKKRTKEFHGGTFDMHVFANHGIDIQGLRSDSLIKAHLAYTDFREYGLKFLYKLIFGEDTQDFSDVFSVPFIKVGGGLSKQRKVKDLIEIVHNQAGIDQLVDYAVKDPFYTLELSDAFDERLVEIPWHGKKTMLDYYNELERPFQETLFAMERRGLPVDVEAMREMQIELAASLQKTLREFGRLCVKQSPRIRRTMVTGREVKVPKYGPSFFAQFNIQSPQQLRGLLVGLGAVGLEKEVRTPNGRVMKDSVDETTLEEAAKKRANRKLAPILRKVVAYRELAKLKGTYLDSYLEEFGQPFSDQRARTRLVQFGAHTGRLASRDTNLQNIPIRSELGARIRKLFRAVKGRQIGDIDLSQIELRLAAHFSKEPALIESYKKGIDVHARTAFEIYPEIEKAVRRKFGTAMFSKEIAAHIAEHFKLLRGWAKNVNFMVLYGGSGQRYHEMTGQSKSVGDAVVARFFQRYPKLERSIRRTIARAHKVGYVQTITNRRVYFPGLKSPVRGIRAAAERACYNALIQGSAADLLKMAMILVERDQELKDADVWMLLQVHDELVFDMPAKVEPWVKERIEDYVSHPYRSWGMNDLAVDTPAELAMAESWGEAH